MALIRTRAVVLRRTNFGEADRILQILTPEGQVSIIAKGVRKEKSKLAGGIELFAISDIVYSQGRGNIGTLTSARLHHFYENIIKDYQRLEFGYEVIKHVSKASQMIDDPAWYDLLVEVLAGLDALTVPPQVIQTWWLLNCANLLGDSLNLNIDIGGERLDPDRKYSYDLHEKGLRPNQQGEITRDHIKYLRIMQVKPLSTVVQIGGVSEILPECWFLARQHAALD